MKFGLCKNCKKLKKLTKHSKKGNHKPPFEYMCRDCHDKKHGIKPHPKSGKKYQPGTPRQHKKKKFWKKK